jgi:three-Cys-motif partner protein
MSRGFYTHRVKFCDRDGGLMTNSEDVYDKLYKELKELRDIGKTVLEKTGGRGCLLGHRWTVLKLLFLKLYVRDIYAPIIANYYPSMAFVDLFAGTGLNKYEGSNFPIPGSTLIAWFCAKYPFDRIFAIGYNGPDELFDLNSGRKHKDKPYKYLCKRVTRFIPKNYLRLIEGDANEKIDEVINGLREMRKRYGGLHYLAFVDPNSCEVHLDTLKKLIDLEKEGIVGDFIILFQARLIARKIGRWIKSEKKGNLAGELDRFFGTEDWRNFEAGRIEDSVINLYEAQLKKLKQKAIVKKLDINLMREGIHYYLFYVTRETSRGSPYTKSVELIEEFVRLIDKEDIVDQAIREALGIKSSLRSFM